MGRWSVSSRQGKVRGTSENCWDRGRRRLKAKDWPASRHSPLPRPLSYTFLQCRVVSLVLGRGVRGGRRIEGYYESDASCAEPTSTNQAPRGLPASCGWSFSTSTVMQIVLRPLALEVGAVSESSENQSELAESPGCRRFLLPCFVLF